MRKPACVSRTGFGRDVSGATAIEFALVAPALIFVLLSLVEMGVLCMMTSGVDNAVNTVARTIRTGQADAPASASEFEARVCERLGGSLSACQQRLSISVQAVSEFSDVAPLAASAPNGQYNKGGPGSVMLVKADYAWPLVTPFVLQGYQRSGPHQVVIASRATFKNEPYQ